MTAIDKSTAAALAKSAACYCFDAYTYQRVLAYLLARIAGGSMVPATLASNSACACFSAGYADRVLAAALCSRVSTGGSSTIASIMERATCFCLPRPALKSVQSWLAWQWSIGGVVDSCDPKDLQSASECMCFSDPVQRAVMIYSLRSVAGLTMTPAELSGNSAGMAFSPNLAGQVIAWLLGPGSPVIATTTVILPDGSGGLWKVIVDAAGNVGTQTDAGPTTPTVILADGLGGFWKLIVDAFGLRGVQSDAGPATTPPVISDGLGGNWRLVVDGSGNVGATSV